MRIRALNKDGLVVGPEIHKSRQDAQFLIDAGTAVAIPERRESCIEAEARVAAIHGSKRTTPKPFWSVRPAEVIHDTRYPPQLYAKCEECGADIFASGPTAEKTTLFRHFASCGDRVQWPNGVIEPVPFVIAKDYVKQRDEFGSRRSRIEDDRLIARKRDEMARDRLLQLVAGETR